MKTYRLSFADAMKHMPEHAERTARRSGAMSRAMSPHGIGKPDWKIARSARTRNLRRV